MGYNVIRLIGLIFLINLLACTSKNSDSKFKKQRIMLTKYKKQLDELVYMQKITKQNIPQLVAKLAKESQPRKKGTIVTNIQRVEKKMKRYQEKANILKTKIIELEKNGVTPLE